MEEETPPLGFGWDTAPRPKRGMLRAQRGFSSLSEPASLKCPGSSGTHVNVIWLETSRQDTKRGSQQPPRSAGSGEPRHITGLHARAGSLGGEISSPLCSPNPSFYGTARAIQTRGKKALKAKPKKNTSRFTMQSPGSSPQKLPPRSPAAPRCPALLPAPPARSPSALLPALTRPHRG